MRVCYINVGAELIVRDYGEYNIHRRICASLCDKQYLFDLSGVDTHIFDMTSESGTVSFRTFTNLRT